MQNPTDNARASDNSDSDKLARSPIRILIVDDHALVRQGLKQVLADAFPKAEFGEADNANAALEKIWKQPWDVDLLDITMPGKSGLDVLKQIVDAQPNLAVLVLIMHPEDQYAVRVLKTGAAGYLTKNTASEEVVGAVKKVLAGGKYVSAALAENLRTKFYRTANIRSCGPSPWARASRKLPLNSHSASRPSVLIAAGSWKK